MEQENFQSFNQSSLQPKSDLPNATAALVLGILSIPLCLCYGIVGLALGITALILGGKAIKLYAQSPDAFTESSFKNAKAGRVCGIIGLSLGALYLVLTIIFVAFGLSSGILEEIMKNANQ